MRSDKEMKKWFRRLASEHPEKYYPVDKLKEFGFHRNCCTQTGIYFWSLDPNRTVCGEPEVQGGFTFIGDTPAAQPIAYKDVWTNFSDFFSAKGYKPLPRASVVARWRDDVYWVAASVYPFQPYVVRGETKPPSNKVTIAQPSLRFNDIDNVGITGSHYTGFVMLGQLAFEPAQKYEPEQYFTDFLSWIVDGMGIPMQEITLHEDTWAGGGTFGPCIEFFVRGMEVGNQVYMRFEQDQDADEGYKELDIKVLDMGQGMERVPWLTSGTSTSYDTTFPTVMDYLYEASQFVKDDTVVQKFLPFAALLNVDEVEDIHAAWQDVAQKVGMPYDQLREKIEPLAALYSVADHTRSALFAFADGAVPSNVGGGYNIRVLVRRALSLIDKYEWAIDVQHVVMLHAKYLHDLYPELLELLPNVQQILSNEIQKYKASAEKSQRILDKWWQQEGTNLHNLSQTEIIDHFVELYDTHGISPERIKQYLEQNKERTHLELENVDMSSFYATLAERHEQQEATTATKKKETFTINPSLQATQILYFDDYLFTQFEAEILDVQGLPEQYTPPKGTVLNSKVAGVIILNKTAFYPTSGGQIHDTGIMHEVQVVDVIKQGNYVLHIVSDRTTFHVGDTVAAKIDLDRRTQVTQHHTSTHIVNAAARRVLGNHINQAGAAKDVDKARLDLTHFSNLNDHDIENIEVEAQKIIAANIPIHSSLIAREEAEQTYGTRIYQGGFVPGKQLRIVRIEDTDIQACGGTHVRTTQAVEQIKITGTSRVQDGIVRIHFVAGNAAKTYAQKDTLALQELETLLGVETHFLPSRAAQLFSMWKKTKKAAKKGKLSVDMFAFGKDEAFEGNVIVELCEVLRTQPRTFSQNSQAIPRRCG